MNSKNDENPHFYMKIGLCTPYKVDNYGTKLQAYAVQEKIKGLGFEVEIIDFDRKSDLRVDKLVRRYLNVDFIRGKLRKQKDLRYKNEEIRANLIIRKDAINCFDDSHYILSHKIKGYKSLCEYGNGCDALVCGSDQIWLPGSINNPTTTLEFAPEHCRRIAFAPSFGLGDIPDTLKRYYKAFLDKFDFLSVREIRGAEIIRELIGKDVPVVLDPTLSIKKSIWDEIAEEGHNHIKEPYMFCYFLGQNEFHRIEAKKISERLGLKVVTLPHFKGFVPADDDLSDYQLYNVTPCDFVRLIRDADYVCTDSFHATVFSILYQKRFMTFERFGSNDKRSANSRIYSLLGQLDLTDHIWTDKTTVFTEDELTDYSNVELKLDLLRKKTNDYLRIAFDGIVRTNEKVASFHEKKQDKCCGCTACASACPQNCIQIIEEESTGFHYPKLDRTVDCLHCNICNSVCPYEKHLNISHTVGDAYYSRSTDSQVLEMSSSGGLFYSLAKKIIQAGGYVCAAAFDEEYVVRHKIIHKKEDLVLLVGSKYSESDIGDCFSRIKELLNKKQIVMFCGTPCQLHGLKSFLRRDYDELISVDLLCYGIQSPKAWKKYLDFVVPKGDKIQSVNMRDKSISWKNYSMHITFTSGEEHLEDKKTDLYSKTYSKGLFIRPSCYSCQLKAFPRKSDITFGDFWDIDKLMPEKNDGRGASIVFPNTEKGHELLNSLYTEGKIIYERIDAMKLKKVHPLFCLNAKKSRNSSKFMRMLQDKDTTFDRIVKVCQQSAAEKTLRTVYRNLRH